MITDLWLVDCENTSVQIDVHTQFMLKNSEKVVYFTSTNTGHKEIVNRKDKEIYCKHNNNHDALDYCLDTVLGYYICLYGKDVKYHIISNDTGFQTLVSFWSSFGYFVTLHRYNPNMAKVIGMKSKVDDKINVSKPKAMGEYTEMVVDFLNSLTKTEMLNLENIFNATKLKYGKSLSRQHVGGAMANFKKYVAKDKATRKILLDAIMQCYF